MRKLPFGILATMVLLLGTTLGAKADSQTFNNAPGGPQTLTYNTGGNFFAMNYTLALSGATGLSFGSCGWLSSCQVTAKFTNIIKGVTYLETITGTWNGLLRGGWQAFTLTATPVQAPEESSLFELLAAALALAIVLPGAPRLRRPLHG
jgi:hypothetical protein